MRQSVHKSSQKKDTHTNCNGHKKESASTATVQRHCTTAAMCINSQTHTYTVERMGLCDINRISSSSLNCAVALFHRHVNRNPIHQVGQTRTRTLRTCTPFICGDKDRFQFPHLILYMTQQPGRERNLWTGRDYKNHTANYSAEMFFSLTFSNLTGCYFLHWLYLNNNGLTY